MVLCRTLIVGRGNPALVTFLVSPRKVTKKANPDIPETPEIEPAERRRRTRPALLF